jgi:hypothetical protein
VSTVGNELQKLRGHTKDLISWFNSSTDLVKARLEELPNVGEVNVQRSVPNFSSFPPSSPLIYFQFGTTFETSLWAPRILFRELRRLEVTQIIQGQSLDGSFVLSYEGQFTDDIPIDASATHVKSLLEALDTVTEVDVKRVDKYTGYQWVVSFTGNAGNLPQMVAHDNARSAGVPRWQLCSLLSFRDDKLLASRLFCRNVEVFPRGAAFNQSQRCEPANISAQWSR